MKTPDMGEFRRHLCLAIEQIDKGRGDLARNIVMRAMHYDMTAVMADTAIMLLHTEPDKAAKAKADLYRRLYGEEA